MNLFSLDTYIYPPEVEWQVDQNIPKEYQLLAKTFNADPAIVGIIIQHEYGIFGGKYGENILAFIEQCQTPIIVTLHTVLPMPNPKMKQITKQIIAKAKGIIVLTQSSKAILEKIYPESLGKVSVIPHGIHETTFTTTVRYAKKLKFNHNIILSTFGLLSRSKGIEYVINALPPVIKKYPMVRYLVLGETHPVVRRKEGEKYRIKLIALADELGLKKQVKFYDQYLSLTNLFEFLKATDIYISSSINPNQAVSGTLSYALGTGRAVISTNFAQAREVINNNTGKLVPIKDAGALTGAILDLLKDPQQLQVMHQYAYDTTRHMVWGNVAKEYLKLLSTYTSLPREVSMVLPPLKLRHLRRMTDAFGLFQFAKYSKPDKAYGYTLDDNARALVVCSWLIQLGQKQQVERLIRTYLSFVKTCQLESGSFINYIDSVKKVATAQNQQENLEEANARALWALSEVLSNPGLPKKMREIAKTQFLKALPQTYVQHFIRPRAFVIKALVKAKETLPKRQAVLNGLIRTQADVLIEALQQHTVDSWQWFEAYLSYNNAILPESLFLAGKSLNHMVYTQAAKTTMEFLIRETFKSDYYCPVGQSDWYRRGEIRSEYDQQPEDPASMVLALVSAYEITHNEAYQHLAYTCFTWFLGNNSLGVPLYNYDNGGCYDGLQPDRVNLNQGAESLVSYLLARLAVGKIIPV